MLSFNKHEDSMRLCYVNIPKKGSIILYFLHVFNKDDIIPFEYQGLLTKYINKKDIQKGRYAISERDYNLVCSMLDTGKTLTTHPQVQQIYNNCIANINNDLPLRFIAPTDDKLIPLPPCVKDQRFFIIATGRSGSGKSCWALDMMFAYRKTYPNRKIYFFSDKDTDKNIDKFTINNADSSSKSERFINRVSKDEWDNYIGKEKKEDEKKESKKRSINDVIAQIEEDNDYDSEIAKFISDYDVEKPEDSEKSNNNNNNDDYDDTTSPVKKYENSLFVFDDINTIANEKQRKRMLEFKQTLTELGRSYSIDLISCTHMLLNYRATRDELNEITGLVFFPQTAIRQHITGYLTRYLRCSKEDISRIIELKSRWVYIILQTPIICITQHEVFILTDSNKKIE